MKWWHGPPLLACKIWLKSNDGAIKKYPISNRGFSDFLGTYNKSLSLGVLPNEWKLAEVTAIYKKGRNLTDVTIGQLV